MEPWFNINYRIEKIAENSIDEFDSNKKGPKANEKANETMTRTQEEFKYKLPEKNPFIADLDSILKKNQKNTNFTKEPKLIVDQSGIKIWCMNNFPFDENPKIDFDLIFFNENLQKTAKNQILLNLFLGLINGELKRELASANEAGNIFYFSENFRGFRIKISGFEISVVEKIAQKIFKIFREFSINSQEFQIAKKIRLEQIEKSILERSFDTLKTEVKILLVQPRWSDQERLMELRGINFVDFEEFVEKILFNDQIAAEALVFGRCDCDASKSYAELLQNGLGMKY